MMESHEDVRFMKVSINYFVEEKLKLLSSNSKRKKT